MSQSPETATPGRPLLKNLFADNFPQNPDSKKANEESFVDKTAVGTAEGSAPAIDERSSGYHDFDLAEFPWAVLSRTDRPSNGQPLVYQDRITNRETGEQVERIFETYPSPEGFPGETAFALFYDLLQLYIEQGSSGDKVVFGTLRNLARRRNLSGDGRTLRRIKRDLDILSGIRLRATNAFWDSKKHAYVHISMWSPFAGSFYFTPQPRFALQEELPFGYVQLHPVLQKIARSRGFFALGFPSEFFYSLKPLEQRLAIYLSRRFHFESVVRRNVDSLAAAMPIRAARADHTRERLKKTADGLKESGYPLLRDYRVYKRRGRWLIEFFRLKRPQPEKPVGAFQSELELTDLEREVISQLIAITDDPDSYYWWAHCVKVLGTQPVFRAIGNFRELYITEGREIRRGKTRGAVMTGVLKGIAKERNIQLGKQ